jgi:uncharacterized protein (TIGR02266 family)
MENKRQTDRKPAKVKAEVHSESAMTYSSSVDLGDGGIFISTPEPLKEGSELSLSLSIGGSDPVELKGIVRWIREDGDDSKRAGMGIEFLGATKDQIEAIKKVIP